MTQPFCQVMTAGLCDNVKHKLYYMNHYQADQKIPKNDIYDYGLWNLNRILVEMGRSLADFPPMPLPQQQQTHRIPNPLLQTEQYNVDEMATLVDKQRAIFNPDQAAAFDAVLESITNNQGHLFLSMLLVVVRRHFCVTLLLLRLEKEVKQHCVWHHLGLLLFYWMEKEHFTHASRFLFLSMKTL